MARKFELEVSRGTPLDTLFMTDKHYRLKLLLLATKAYMHASNVTLDRQQRATCIEFLHKINSGLINLKYEGEEFTMHVVVFSTICIIKNIHGSEVACVEALRFYPEFAKYDFLYDAIKSPMFEVETTDFTNPKGGL